MGLIRRRPRRSADPEAAAAAAERAAEGDQRATRELAEQRSRAAAEHRDLVMPLRKIRERNHLSEDIAMMLMRGYGGRGS
jgi:hypothetical protein